MQRVGINRNPATDLYGAGKHGFKSGDPQGGIPATTPGAEFFNAVQEELAAVVEAMGIALDSSKRNQVLTAIQTMLRGSAPVNVAGGAQVVLTPAQYGLPILILTGVLTANINLIFPAISGAWIVRNQTTGVFNVTCKTAAGTGVAVSQGYNNALWGDGTNIYAEQSDWLNIALTGTPTAPTAAAGTNNTQLANMAAVQQAINGKLTKSVAGGGTVTLTAADAGYGIIEFTGALTANIAVVVPNVTGQWIFKNATTGAFTLTVKTAAGTGASIVQGLAESLWCDGINVLEADGGKADKASTLAGYGITDGLRGQVQTFTASGSFTVPAGVTQVFVTGVAGGSGGGSGSNSGSTGGMAGQSIIRQAVNVTPGQVITVTIGAGGVGFGAGGNTVFGAITLVGGPAAFNVPNNVWREPGQSSPFGLGGNYSGGSAIGYGAGGGGNASGGAWTGGTGSPGFIQVEW